MSRQGWEDLGAAVVRQAATDWRCAAKTLLRSRDGPGAEQAERTLDECTRFFTGKWIATFTDVDGAFILRKLREELGCEELTGEKEE